MANIKKINSGFTQIGPCCIVSSYSIVLSYYSETESVDDIINEYCRFRGINVGSKNERENSIARDYGEYCARNDMRGLEYIREIHINPGWEKNGSCLILQSKAQIDALPEGDVRDVFNELKKGDRLMMVVYQVNQRNCHCIVVGWDSEKLKYFIRDPNAEQYEYKDIESQPINEFILFEKRL